MKGFTALGQQDIQKSINMQDVISTVEGVYRAKSRGETAVWPTVFYEFEPGKADLDIKSGIMKGMGLFGHKTVSWFGENAGKGLPELMGLIVVYDAKTGCPVGLTDGVYITGLRTGAAGAIGAKYLARQDAEHLLIVGCGAQALFQIAAMLSTIKTIRTVSVVNPHHPEKAASFIRTVSEKLEAEFHISCSGISFDAPSSLPQAVGDSDIIVTITPSRTPIIERDWVKPGTHFSCIGADMEGKEELQPEILQSARIYADDMMHSIAAGEVELPLKSGIIQQSDLLGEIGDMMEGRVAGRTSEDEITVFDSVGMALLDIAVADKALKNAVHQGIGQTILL